MHHTFHFTDEDGIRYEINVLEDKKEFVHLNVFAEYPWKTDKFEGRSSAHIFHLSNKQGSLEPKERTHAYNRPKSGCIFFEDNYKTVEAARKKIKDPDNG